MAPRACDPSEAKSSDQFLQNANQILLPHRLAAIWGDPYPCPQNPEAMYFQNLRNISRAKMSRFETITSSQGVPDGVENEGTFLTMLF